MTTITERPHKVAGEVLRATREGTGISRRTMAVMTGCSSGHLARVESGECALTVDLADRINRAIAHHILERLASPRVEPLHATRQRPPGGMHHQSEIDPMRCLN